MVTQQEVSMNVFGDNSVGGAFETHPHVPVEHIMKQLGIVFSVEKVNVSTIDQKDNRYQTRINAAETLTGSVSDYCRAIKSGDSFPMIVLQRKSKGVYRVVCGRNRAAAYAAAANGRVFISTYVVAEDTDTGLLTALSSRENLSNGDRQGSLHAVSVAVGELMATDTDSKSKWHSHAVVKEMAARFAVNDTTLDNHYKARCAEKEMLRVGVAPSGTSVSVLRCLFPWFESAEWPRLAKAVSDNSQSTGLQKLVETAKKQKYTADALADEIQMLGKAKSDSVRLRAAKDPIFCTMEHLQFAINDLDAMRDPSTYTDDQVEDLKLLVDALRKAHKDWSRNATLCS